jgi:hypothetical protein
MTKQEAHAELDLARNGRYGSDRRAQMHKVINRIYDGFEATACKLCGDSKNKQETKGDKND